MRFLREQLLVYAITDRKGDSDLSLCEKVRRALAGGATIVQLREKELPEEEFYAEALEIKEICRAFGAPFLINDNVGLAIKCGADGVHVGSDDLPVDKIRRIVPRDFIVGATAKTVEQARAAERAGADYLGVGAVFPSPTKPGAVRITREELKAISDSVRIPTVAIGGITLQNMERLKGGGMHGFAFVSAIFAADDITAATGRLRKKAETLISLKDNI